MRHARDGTPIASSISPAQRIARGVLRRCPVCGSGELFDHWFSMKRTCPRCGLRFHREAGHWSGHIGINTIVSFGSLLVVLLAFSIATWPELAVVPMLITSVAVGVVMPVVFFPSSKTLWLAIDLLINPLRPGEVRPPFGPEADHDTGRTDHR
jgi:uncharacterized protein (DUF983 family)